MTDLETNLVVNLPIPESGHDFDTIFSTREACLTVVVRAPVGVGRDGEIANTKGLA